MTFRWPWTREKEIEVDDPNLKDAELRAKDITIRADKVVIALTERKKVNGFAEGIEQAWGARHRRVR